MLARGMVLLLSVMAAGCHWLLPLAPSPELPVDAPSDLPVVHFIRGDANGDGIIDSKDAQYIGDYLFDFDEAKLLFNCEDALDVNGDGRLDISDAGAVTGQLLGTKQIPPPNSCAEEPVINLGCVSFPACAKADQ